MKEKIKTIVCAFMGHSRISTWCFGYRYCARCGAGVIIANLKNRIHCGKCSYTEFLSVNEKKK